MAKTQKTSFIVSDSKNPSVTLKPGQKFHVTTVQLVEPTLRPSKKVAARLCGGTSTCLALVNIGDELTNPGRK